MEEISILWIWWMYIFFQNYWVPKVTLWTSKKLSMCSLNSSREWISLITCLIFLRSEKKCMKARSAFGYSLKVSFFYRDLDVRLLLRKYSWWLILGFQSSTYSFTCSLKEERRWRWRLHLDAFLWLIVKKVNNISFLKIGVLNSLNPYPTQ